MKRINLKSASNQLSNNDMKRIVGGNGGDLVCEICHCVDDQTHEQASDEQVWCGYDWSDFDFYINYYCPSGLASCH